MNKRKLQLLLSIPISFILFLSLPLIVLAQDTNRGLIVNITSHTENISINSNTVFAKIEPEEISLFSMELVNDYSDNRSITVIPSIENILLENSVPVIDDSTRELNDNPKAWIALDIEKDSPISLGGGENKGLTATLNIPSGARPGTHQVMINFPIDSGEEASTDNTVGLNSTLRVLVFFTVEGDFTFEPSIKDFYIADAEGNKKDEFRSGEKAFAHVILGNTGNIYYRPYGDVFVYRDISDPIEKLEFNPNDNIVPHNNTREFVYEINTGSFYNQDGTNFFNQYNWSNFFDFTYGSYKVSYNGIFKPSTEVDANKLDNATKAESIEGDLKIVSDQVKILIGLVVFVLTLGGLIILIRKLTSQNKVKL